MNTTFSLLTTDEARQIGSPAHRWLWHGYLASGMIALMTSRWKTGKTTLIAHMLARMETGGMLAGAAVAKGRTAIITEEPMSLWLDRAAKLGFGQSIHWCSRPFHTRPTHEQLEALIERIAECRADLVVIDPLAMILPNNVENSASAILTALEPLRLLTNPGTAVLILHHPRKNRQIAELDPRGSGALCGTADILIELNTPINLPLSPRLRRLRCTSRLQEPVEVLIELAEDARSYNLVTEPLDDGFKACWNHLRSIFEESSYRLTRKDVYKYWPPDFERPSLSTITRWLNRCLTEKKLIRKGKGTYLDPYQYSLPGFVPLLPDLPPLPPLSLFD